MGNASAHHTGIRSHRYDLRNTCSGKNTVIGIVAFLIILLQILLGCMKGVGILHRKFSHTNHTGSRSSFITELSLNLINHKRILLIGLSVFPYQMHCCLFMGHSQHHFGLASILKTHQFASDTVISS